MLKSEVLETFTQIFFFIHKVALVSYFTDMYQNLKKNNVVAVVNNKKKKKKKLYETTYFHPKMYFSQAVSFTPYKNDNFFY